MMWLLTCYIDFNPVCTLESTEELLSNTDSQTPHLTQVLSIFETFSLPLGDCNAQLEMKTGMINEFI